MTIYQALIATAADLWAGSDLTDMDRNPEYLRGQVELIADATGVADKEKVEDDLREAIAKKEGF